MSWKLWGFASQLPLQPLDGGGLVDDEDLELHHVLGRQALLVVLGDLFEEKDHAVAFGEAVGETGQELAERQGHGDVAQDMEGDHAVEQQMRLALVDDLHPPVLGHEHGQLAEMGAEKVPDSLLGAARVSVKRSSRPSLGL